MKDLESSAPSPSVTILMFISWIIHVIEKGKHGRGGAHSKTTPIRYFDSLRRSIEDLGYCVDLLAMDEDDITEFYGQIVNDIKLRHLRPAYAFAQLNQFHTFARDMGCEEPDWDELPEIIKGRRVAAGILLEEDYLKTFELLQGHGLGLDDNSRDQMTFILLACYRFGLRRMEAVGLLRRDWCIEGNAGYVAVLSNRLRKPKTHNARRAIPLIWPLRLKEKQFIERMITTYEASHPDNNKQSIVLALGGTIRGIHSLTEILIKLLKRVTGNPKTTLHHCRHAFCNYAAHHLLTHDTVCATRLMSRKAHEYPVAEITLGPQCGNSRRQPMAVARLMGHGRPSTWVHSYYHMLGEWADELVDVDKSYARTNHLEQVRNLDAELSSARAGDWLDVSLLEKEVTRYQPATMSKYMYLLVLASKGKDIRQSGQRLMLDPADVDGFSDTLDRVCQKLEYKNIPVSESANMDPVRLFLSRITQQQWSILLRQCRDKDATPGSQGIIKNEDFTAMIGPSRQLLAWDPIGIEAIRSFMKLFDIPFKNVAVRYTGKGSSIRNNLDDYFDEHELSELCDGGFTPDACQYSKKDGIGVKTETWRVYYAFKFRLNRKATRNRPDLSFAPTEINSTFMLVALFLCFAATSGAYLPDSFH